jgi:hypothetical protein
MAHPPCLEQPGLVADLVLGTLGRGCGLAEPCLGPWLYHTA